MRSSPAWLLVALVCAGPACSKKTPECNSVVEVVNSFGDKTKVHEAPSPDIKAHAAALKSIAAEEQKAGAELAKLPITMPEIKKSAGALEADFKANAAASLELAGMLEKLPDAAQAQALDKKIAKARETVDNIEEEISRACDDAPDECGSLAAVLKNHPDEGNIDSADAAKTKAWAATNDKWADDLVKAEVKEASMKEKLKKLSAAVKEMAALVVQLTGMTSDEPKREAAQKLVEKSAADLGSHVDDLNKFCQE